MKWPIYASFEDPMLHKERGLNLSHAFNKAFEDSIIER